MINRLLAITFPKSVPNDIVAGYKDIMENYQLIDPALLHSTVLECVGALMGIPQVRQADLVIEGRTFYDLKWTNLAKTVMTSIFHESCSRELNFMEYHDVSKFLEKINKIKPSQALVNSHLNFSNRVTLDQFLKFYLDRTKETWKVLRAFNYRNDLTRTGTKTGDASASASASASAVDIHHVYSSEQLGLSGESLHVLNDADFITSSFHLSIEHAQEIMRRYIQIQERPEETTTILFFRLVQVWLKTKPSMPMLNSMKFILCEWITFSDNAFRTILMHNRHGLLRLLVAHVGNNQIANPIIILLSHLSEEFPQVLVLTRSLKNEILPQAYNKIKGTSPGFPFLSKSEIIDIKRLVIRVAGSGIDAAINGDYIFNGFFKSTGVYRHKNGRYSIGKTHDKAWSLQTVGAVTANNKPKTLYFGESLNDLVPKDIMFDTLNLRTKISLTLSWREIEGGIDDNDDEYEEEEEEGEEEEEEDVSEDIYYN